MKKKFLYLAVLAYVPSSFSMNESTLGNLPPVQILEHSIMYALQYVFKGEEIQNPLPKNELDRYYEEVYKINKKMRAELMLKPQPLPRVRDGGTLYSLLKDFETLAILTAHREEQLHKKINS